MFYIYSYVYVMYIACSCICHMCHTHDQPPMRAVNLDYYFLYNSIVCVL